MPVIRPALLLLAALPLVLAGAPGQATLPASTVIHSTPLGLDQVTGGQVTAGGTVFARAIRDDVPLSDSCVVFVWSGGSPSVHSEAHQPFPAAGPGGERGCAYGASADVSRMLDSVFLDGDDVDSTNDSAVVVLGGSGPGVLLVREGDPAPGGGADTYIDFIDASSFVFDGSRVAFETTLDGAGVAPGEGAALFVGSAGSVVITLQTGAATAIGPLESIRDVRLAPGSVYFGGSSSGQRGLFAVGSAGPVALAVSGSSAPGTSSTFDSFASPERSSSGDIAFRSRLADFTEGIWAGSGPAFRKVAATGDLAPNGFIYYGVSSAYTISPSGRVAFAANSGNHDGIFAERPDPGDVVELAREGDDVPGLSGLTFAGFTGSPLIDSVGRVTFEARLAGPGVTSASNESIWTSLPDGELRLVAREGDEILVGGVERTIVGTLDLPSNGSLLGGRPTTITEQGQVIYIARFDDDSEALMSVFVEGGRPGLVSGDGFETGDLSGWDGPHRSRSGFRTVAGWRPGPEAPRATTRVLSANPTLEERPRERSSGRLRRLTSLPSQDRPPLRSDRCG